MEDRYAIELMNPGERAERCGFGPYEEDEREWDRESRLSSDFVSLETTGRAEADAFDGGSGITRTVRAAWDRSSEDA